VCLRRAQRLREGARLTEALAELTAALGVGARVLPMSDGRVRTRVRTHGAWHPLQEFMIRERARGPVEGVELEGADAASPSPEALEALAGARAVVIGPSNPVISIGPILALPGVREALAETPAPVVAVSPLVHREVVKGPTAAFMEWAGRELSPAGVAAGYDGLLDGMVADERVPGLPTLETDVDMPDAAGRARLAEATLTFAAALRG
jgi:LPPG:FO 2-phospho-L-lactate transferase